MDQSQLKRVADFIWNIADSGLRDTEQVPLKDAGGILRLEQQTEGLLHKIVGCVA